MESASLEKESSSSSSLVDSYIGSLISLTSKSEIRYEGLLVSINPHQSTIALQNVRSYGTEGRGKDGSQIPSSDKEYEYILFRGSDIKDLQVKSSSSFHTMQQKHTDPAIIQEQSQYACAPNTQTSAAPVEGGPITSLNSKVIQPDLTRQPVPATQSLCQTGAHLSPWASSTSFANADGSMYSQGYVGNSSSQDYAERQSFPSQPHTATLQNQLQLPEGYAATGMQQFREPDTPTSFPSQFAHSNPTYSPSLLSSNTSVASVLPSHFPPVLSHASSNQELHNMGLIYSKAGPYPSVSLPASSLPASLVNLGSASGPITTVPPLLTPGHPMSSATAATSSVSKVYAEQIDTGSQVPLLAVPTSKQLGEHMEKQFDEEFDFMAMNEKFNKHEVWGSLGVSKQRGTIRDGIEDVPTHRSEVFEGYVQDTPTSGSKPVYKKDDFFDTLSCNSLNHGGWSGRTKFSERMRLDSETFGNFQHKIPPGPGRGDYGASYSGNYRAPYNRGRGYDHCWARGGGGFRPFN